MNFHTYTKTMDTIYVVLKSGIQNWHNGLQLTNINSSMASELPYCEDDLLRLQGKGTTMPRHVPTNRQAENRISRKPSNQASESPWNFRYNGTFRKLAKNLRLSAAVLLFIFTGTFTFMPIVASATVLSDMAASLAPGQWAELPAPVGMGATLGTNGASGHKLTYATVGAWDPISKRIYFCGMDHELAHQTCQIYTEATHTWSILPTQPPWAGGTSPPIHGYDHNVLDANGRAFYHRPYVSKNVYTCNIGFDPNCTSWSLAFTDSDMAGDLSGHAFAPWRGTSGRMVYYSVFNSTSSIVKEWDPNTRTSTTVGTIPMAGQYGGIVVECSDGSPNICYLATDSTSLYTLNASGTLTARPTAPCSMHWNTSVSTVDPATGSLVTFCPSSVHEFNPTTNAWRQVSGTTPAHQFVSQWSNGALVVSVPAYGVIVVLGGNLGTSDATKKMWVYKHAAGTGSPGDTQAPTIPGSLSTTAASSSQISLTWSASTDNVGVMGYKVLRNGSQIGIANGTSYTDTGLSASTTYFYNISAFDAAGNTSSTSSPSSSTTLPTSGGSGGSADFQTRCSAPGVLVCEGFDDASDFVQPSWPGIGLYPSNGCPNVAARDTSVVASGTSSLRMNIVGGSTGCSPFWYQDFSGQGFAAGETFYVQFRQRFDTNMLTADFGGGGWKQVIFHNHTAGSCALLEITTNNYRYRKFPQMYSECGARDPGYSVGNNYYLEYSNPYPPGSDGAIYCEYNKANAGDSTNKCAYYRANEWMTFYYRITIGSWGQPNSTIQAWAGYENQPLMQFINNTNYVLNKDTCTPQSACDDGFNRLMLTVYDTGKDGRQHPTAFTWFDELIISTQPIQTPGGGGTANPPPAPPANLRIQ